MSPEVIVSLILFGGTLGSIASIIILLTWILIEKTKERKGASHS